MSHESGSKHTEILPFSLTSSQWDTLEAVHALGSDFCEKGAEILGAAYNSDDPAVAKITWLGGIGFQFVFRCYALDHETREKILKQRPQSSEE